MLCSSIELAIQLIAYFMGIDSFLDYQVTSHHIFTMLTKMSDPATGAPYCKTSSTYITHYKNPVFP